MNRIEQLLAATQATTKALATETVQGDLAPQPGDPEAVPTNISTLFRWVSRAVLAPMLQMQQAFTLMSAKFVDLAPRLALSEAALASTQAELMANTAADQLRAAKADLTESAMQAMLLEMAALKSRATAAELATGVLQVRATADEAAIAAAQAKAESANIAALAARARADAAQAKADEDATLALAAKAAAEAAQATATAAQASFTALAGRFRNKRVNSTAVGIGGTMTLNVVWDTPFADANYNAVAEMEGIGLLGLNGVVTNRTATGCTVSIKNVLGLVLIAGAGIVTVTAIHDAT